MPDTPPKDEAFLSRWSRLKTDTAPPVPEEMPAASLKSSLDTDAATPDEALSDTELLEKYALPDPDEMKAGDDFSAFMQNQVPDHLRRKALRVLWGSNPVLANLDELVDYGEDFTDAATVIENMQTIYRVGKGSAWKFQEEQTRLAEEKAARDAEELLHRTTETDEDETVTEQDLAEETTPADTPDSDSIESADSPQNEENSAVLTLGHEEAAIAENIPTRPRPMRFQFQ